MGPDIFISFEREDLDRVEPLIKTVESLGYGVWRDTDLPSAGASWTKEIEEIIAAARCVLVVWTAATRRSPALLVDAARASVAKKLLSVWLDPIDPSVQLLNIPHIDLAGWDGRPGHARFQRLARDIAKLAGPAPAGAAAAERRTESQPARRLRVPDIAWVEIPGGPFIYQQGETRELPTFWIARYPVTNAQYQTFIDDGGYDEPRWWTDLKRPTPDVPFWPQANRPRTNVDWYECVAFGRWLNARLGLPEGSIRLPTELEWEKCARGERGLAYPWGDEFRSGFANVNETIGERKGPWYLEQTTAVGLYPQASSPYGVEDLAGTIWEWCQNKDDELEAIAPNISVASRALRGGSWVRGPANARADHRYSTPPDFRNPRRGIRLLSSVSIELVR